MADVTERAILELITEAQTAGLDQASASIDSNAASIAGLATAMTAASSTALDARLQSVATAGTAARSAIGGLAAAGEAISHAFDGVGNAAEAGFQHLVAGVGTAVDAINAKFESLSTDKGLASIGTTTAYMAAAIAEIPPLFDVVGGAGQSAGSAIEQGFKQAAEGLSGMISALRDLGTAFSAAREQGASIGEVVTQGAEGADVAIGKFNSSVRTYLTGADAIISKTADVARAAPVVGQAFGAMFDGLAAGARIGLVITEQVDARLESTTAQAAAAGEALNQGAMTAAEGADALAAAEEREASAALSAAEAHRILLTQMTPEAQEAKALVAQLRELADAAGMQASAGSFADAPKELKAGADEAQQLANNIEKVLAPLETALNLGKDFTAEMAAAKAEFASINGIGLTGAKQQMMTLEEQISAIATSVHDLTDQPVKLLVDDNEINVTVESLMQAFDLLAKHAQDLVLDMQTGGTQEQLRAIDAELTKLAADAKAIQISGKVDPSTMSDLATIQARITQLTHERGQIGLDTSRVNAELIRTEDQLKYIHNLAQERFGLNLDIAPFMAKASEAQKALAAARNASGGAGGGANVGSLIGRTVNAFQLAQGGGVGGAVNAVQSLGGELGQLAEVAGPAGVAVAGVAAAVVLLAAPSIAAAAQVQTLHTQLEILTGSTAKADEAMRSYQKVADLTPLGLEDVAQAGKQLQQMTDGAYSGTKALKLIADVASVTGESMNSLSDDFGQLYQGIAQGGTSIQGAISRFQRLGVLAPGMRHAFSEIAREVKTGALSIEDGSKLALAQFDKFAGAGQKLQGTFNGAAEKMSGQLNKAFQAFGNVLLPIATAGIEVITHALVQLEQAFKLISTGIDGVIAAGEALVKFGHQIPIVTNALDGLSGAFDALAKHNAEQDAIQARFLKNVERGVTVLKAYVSGTTLASQAAQDNAKAVADAQSTAMDAYTQALIDGPAKVKESFDKTTAIVAEQGNQTSQVAKLIGEATSKALADGLASGNPAVRQQAEETRGVIDQQLRLLATDPKIVEGIAGAFAAAGKTVDDSLVNKILTANTRKKIEKLAHQAGISLTDPMIEALLANADNIEKTAAATLTPDIQARIAFENEKAGRAAADALFDPNYWKKQADSTFAAAQSAATAASGPIGDKFAQIAFVASDSFNKALAANDPDVSEFFKAFTAEVNASGSSVSHEMAKFADAISVDKTMTAQAGKEAVESFVDGALKAGVDQQTAYRAAIERFGPDAFKAAAAGFKEAGKKNAEDYFTSLIESGKTDKAALAAVARAYPDSLKAARSDINEIAQQHAQTYADGIASAAAAAGEGGRKVMREVGAGMAAEFPGLLSKNKFAFAEIGAQSMLAYAQGVRDNRTQIDDAYHQLQTDLTNPFSKAKEVARLEGGKVGHFISEGLKSKDPEVRAQAEGTAALIAERLQTLGIKPDKIKGPTGRAIRAALKAAESDAKPGIDGVLQKAEDALKAGADPLTVAAKTALDAVAAVFNDPAYATNASADGTNIGNSFMTGVIGAINAKYNDLKAAYERVHALTGPGGSPPKDPASPFHNVDDDGYKTGTAYMDSMAKAVTDGVAPLAASLNGVHQTLTGVGAQPNGLGLRPEIRSGAIAAGVPRGTVGDRGTELLGQIVAALRTGNMLTTKLIPTDANPNGEMIGRAIQSQDEHLTASMVGV